MVSLATSLAVYIRTVCPTLDCNPILAHTRSFFLRQAPIYAELIPPIGHIQLGPRKSEINTSTLSSLLDLPHLRVSHGKKLNNLESCLQPPRALRLRYRHRLPQGRLRLSLPKRARSRSAREKEEGQGGFVSQERSSVGGIEVPLLICRRTREWPSLRWPPMTEHYGSMENLVIT